MNLWRGAASESSSLVGEPPLVTLCHVYSTAMAVKFLVSFKVDLDWSETTDTILTGYYLNMVKLCECIILKAHACSAGGGWHSTFFHVGVCSPDF